jgi:hypothetical protein
MNQIEKLTLNYHVNKNKLQTLGEKIDKKRIADKKSSLQKPKPTKLESMRPPSATWHIC